MSQKRSVSIWMTAAVLLLAVTGCLLSGTFVVVEDFSFTAQDGFYFYRVDVTNEPEWVDNKDYIDLIEAVGFEFYITNTSSEPATFTAYVDEYQGVDNPTEVPEDATQILTSLTINPGKTKITYAQSLSYITNLPTIRALAETGKFDFYGVSDAADGATFHIDSGKVIITVSASK